MSKSQAKKEEVLVNDPGESRLELIQRVIDEVLSGTAPRKKPAIPLGPPRRGVEKKAIMKALVVSLGRVSHASIILGINPKYLRSLIREDEELQKLQEEIQEFRIDIAEKRLDKRVLEDKWGAVQFLLETQGRHRGYTKRQEVAVASENKLIFEFSDGSVDKDA